MSLLTLFRHVKEGLKSLFTDEHSPDPETLLDIALHRRGLAAAIRQRKEWARNNPLAGRKRRMADPVYRAIHSEFCFHIDSLADIYRLHGVPSC